MHKPLVALAASALIAALSTRAAAQAPPPSPSPSPPPPPAAETRPAVTLDVTGRVDGVDVAAVRAAIEHELGRPVALATDGHEGGAGRVTVVVDVSRAVVVIYRDPAGREVVRSQPMPATLEDLPAIVALVTGVLTRPEPAAQPPAPSAPATPPTPPPTPAPPRQTVPLTATGTAARNAPRVAVRGAPRAERDTFYERFGGRLAIFAQGGAVFSDGPSIGWAVAGGMAARFGHFTIGLDGGYASDAAPQDRLSLLRTTGFQPSNVNASSRSTSEHWWISSIARASLNIGPLMFEATAGLGVLRTGRLTVEATQRVGFQPQNITAETLDEYVTLGARLGVGLALQIARGFDLVLRVDLHSALPPSLPGAQFATALLGVQGRLGR